MRRLATVPVLLAAVFLLPSAGETVANPAGRDLVSSAPYGLRLSLDVPQRSYPFDALIRVRLQAWNLSPSAIVFPRACLDENPRVESLSQTGVRLYPPPIPYVSGSPCMPFADSGLLLPGGHRELRLYTIVRGPVLQAAVTFAPAGRPAARTLTVRTGAVRVGLSGGVGPVVRECKSHRCADVYPPAGVHVSGPLLYAYVATCAKGHTLRIVQHDVLKAIPAGQVTRRHGVRLQAPCRHPLAWHFVAGWVDQPVADIRF